MLNKPLIANLSKLNQLGHSIPEATVELSKLLGVTFEEARSFKETAIKQGFLTRLSNRAGLELTVKGKNLILTAYKTTNSKTSKATSTVVRRAASSKPLNNTEKTHFVNHYEKLSDTQLVLYHLILATGLGEKTFNYLSFKLVQGVLRIDTYKTQHRLKELENLELIRLEGIQGNHIKLNHSYHLLSQLFPKYCGANRPAFNAKLSELYFNPNSVEIEKLRNYPGREVISPKKTITKNETTSQPILTPLKSATTTTPIHSNPSAGTESTQACTDSVLSVGELRHHTVQNHSSMPEINRAYWDQPSFNMGNPTLSPMMAQSTPSPYPVRRHPLTILIDGDQQSLRNFLKEAQLDRLRSGDSIYLFSVSGAHSKLSLELVQRIEELKENVYFKRVTSEIRRPNTMDQLIMTRLTMLLTVDFNRDFIILSEDKGFAGAITMLNDTYNLRRGQIQLQSIAIL